jgi:diguanylate cyclase (GGDEF)-like protein
MSWRSRAVRTAARTSAEATLGPPDDPRSVEIVVSPLAANPLTPGLVMSMRDVTERRKLQEELEHRALHDELTGLPNRALLKDRLTTALSAGARDHRSVAVLLCDLDGFHDVNVTAGRAAGDAVLVETARRLEAVVGPHDTVARLGDDEFVVICPVLDDDMTAYLLGQRIRTALSRPYLVTPTDDTTHDDSARDDSAQDHSRHDDATQAVQSDLELSLGVSIGAAASRPGVSPVQLLAAADAAMHADRRAAQQAAARAAERTDLATAG